MSNCNNCKKLGEAICGNEIDGRCFEPKEPQITKCKNCGKKFSGGSLNNPAFCSDDCNYDYHADQLE